MLKKTLIISISFFILAVAITGYVLFYKKSPSVSTTQNGLPLGDSSDTSTFGTSDQQSSNVDQNGNYSIPVRDLMNLSEQPIAGAFVIQAATSTVVRYNLRSSGHVFEVNLITGTSSKLSNTTIPKIYESHWFNKGTQALIRYLNDSGETIITYNAQLLKSVASSTSEIGTISGTFMPSNISSLVISPSSKELFYLLEGESSLSGRGIVTDSSGSKQTQIFSSPISEWNIQWPEASTISLTTKPSRGINGYSYFLNTKTKALKKVMGDIPGLTTLVNPTGELVAYANDMLNLSIYTIKSGTAVATNVRTLTEKCVWSQKNKAILYCAVPSSIPTGSFPDDWYQGKVSFGDEIYRINTLNKQYEQVSTLAQSYTNPLDIINPMLSDQGDYIIFTNKIDSSLWSLHLAQ